MRIKLLILSFVLFFSCESLSPDELFRHERDRKIHQVLRNFTKAMKVKGFQAAGIGEGLNHSNGRYNYLGVTFSIESLPSIDLARGAVVETIQEFLRHINSEEGVQDYIDEYPFSLKNIRICIISQNDKTGLFSVSNFKNELIYRRINPENPMGPSLEIHTESYSDAIRILNEQEKICIY